jgi:hypothetical protein
MYKGGKPMSIEKRLTRLEQLVDSLIKRIDNEKFYSDADTNGVRVYSSQANEKASGNEDGLLDIATVADENSECTLELAEMISELEDRVATIEGGN